MADYCHGIYLTDEELRDKSMPLGPKVLLKLIQREIDASGRHCVVRYNQWFADLLGVDKKTVKRWLQDLEGNGHIAIVQVNRRVGNDIISNTRYLYTDTQKAGHRRRRITRNKRPMEDAYDILVRGRIITEQTYVKLARDATRKAYKAAEREDEERAIRCYIEWIAELTDKEVEEEEKRNGVEAGTYLKIKKDYKAKMKEYSNDDLFDD